MLTTFILWHRERAPEANLERTTTDAVWITAERRVYPQFPVPQVFVEASARLPPMGHSHDAEQDLPRDLVPFCHNFAKHGFWKSIYPVSSVLYLNSVYRFLTTPSRGWFFMKRTSTASFSGLYHLGPSLTSPALLLAQEGCHFPTSQKLWVSYRRMVARRNVWQRIEIPDTHKSSY